MEERKPPLRRLPGRPLGLPNRASVLLCNGRRKPISGRCAGMEELLCQAAFAAERSVLSDPGAAKLLPAERAGGCASPRQRQTRGCVRSPTHRPPDRRGRLRDRKARTQSHGSTVQLGGTRIARLPKEAQVRVMTARQQHITETEWADE